MTSESNETDALWAQIHTISQLIDRQNQTLFKIQKSITKLNLRASRLEEKEILNPVRVTVEFTNEKDAKRFTEYVKAENDVAIPNPNRMLDDDFLSATVVEE